MTSHGPAPSHPSPILTRCPRAYLGHESWWASFRSFGMTYNFESTRMRSYEQVHQKQVCNASRDPKTELLVETLGRYYTLGGRETEHGIMAGKRANVSFEGFLLREVRDLTWIH
eukprot:6664577-Prymnesium_polylepis.1